MSGDGYKPDRGPAFISCAILFLIVLVSIFFIAVSALGDPSSG
ncbi:MAG TPA: hypothetical protein VH331_11505 [Allosphingosinicella sp.]|jgi:hypothetical protein|nr:hypothetical protein [Allosphingosinicella sp.]